MKVRVAIEVAESKRRYARFSLYDGDHALFRRILTAYGTTVKGMRTKSGSYWRPDFVVPMSAARLAAAALTKHAVQLYAPKELQVELQDAAWTCTTPNLYPYQRAGAEFLRSRRRALLADQMGTGKTPEALAALDIRKGALIVVPPVVLGNWHQEAKRWRPDFAVTLWKRPFPLFPKPGEIQLVTYMGLPWESVEKRTRCPYCNVLSVVETALPVIPKTADGPSFCPPFDDAEDVEELDEAALDALASFRAAEAAVALPQWSHHCARERGGCGKKFDQQDDVWPEYVWVGEKSQNPVQLVVDEAHYCKNPKSKRAITVRAVASQCSSTWLLTGTPLLNYPPELWALCQVFPAWGKRHHDGGAADVFGSWWNFVELFGGEKKHFGGYDWTGPSKKTEPEIRKRLASVMLRRTRKEVLPELPVKTRRVIQVDVDHTELSKLVYVTGDDLMRFENWSDDDVLRECEQGGALSMIRKELAALKYKPLLSLLEDCEASREPAIVFSFHRAPIEKLGARGGWGCITGSTPDKQRTALVESFQAGSLLGIAGTIGAMGVGVTLTRSANMFFLDRDFVPANNLQAEDRFCRIGQTRGALVTILNTDHPVDQRVASILERKEKLLDQMHLGEAQ